MYKLILKQEMLFVFGYSLAVLADSMLFILYVFVCSFWMQRARWPIEVPFFGERFAADQRPSLRVKHGLKLQIPLPL